MVAGDLRFWVFAAASALQASHQVYYGFGTLHWRSLGLLGRDHRPFMGRRRARRDPAVLARPAPCRPVWTGRIDDAGGRCGDPALEPRGLVSWLPAIAALQLLHALTFGASHLGAMHFLVTRPCRSPLPHPRKAFTRRFPRAWAAGLSCCGRVALCGIWRRRLFLHGRPFGGRAARDVGLPRSLAAKRNRKASLRVRPYYEGNWSDPPQRSPLNRCPAFDRVGSASAMPVPPPAWRLHLPPNRSGAVTGVPLSALLCASQLGAVRRCARPHIREMP